MTDDHAVLPAWGRLRVVNDVHDVLQNARPMTDAQKIRADMIDFLIPDWMPMAALAMVVITVALAILWQGNRE